VRVVTFECDEPPAARQDKTVVVGGRDTSGMTPAAIGACVRAEMAAGGRPVAAHPGGRSAQASWEQITAERPEVAVVAPCGIRLDGAAAQAGQVTRQLPGVPAARACRW